MRLVGKVANGSEDTQREPTVENNNAGCSRDNKFKSPEETKPASLACDASDARVGILWAWLWIMVLGAPTV